MIFPESNPAGHPPREAQSLQFSAAKLSTSGDPESIHSLVITQPTESEGFLTAVWPGTRLSLPHSLKPQILRDLRR